MFCTMWNKSCLGFSLLIIFGSFCNYAIAQFNIVNRRCDGIQSNTLVLCPFVTSNQAECEARRCCYIGAGCYVGNGGAVGNRGAVGNGGTLGIRSRGALSLGFEATVRSFVSGGRFTSSSHVLGGEPNYPGSSLVKLCLREVNNRQRRCGSIVLTGPRHHRRSQCIRQHCCYIERTESIFGQNRDLCAQSINYITFLRKKCGPGLTNPPKCDEVNKCDPNPCENDGTCKKAINSFTCDCRSGFSGVTCNARDCSLPTIQNGVVSNSQSSITSGASIFVTCDTGYQVDGSASLTCQQNGTFGTLPQCIRGCKVPLLQSGTVSPPVRIVSPGTSVSFSCSPGYIFNGTTPIICMDSGEFPGENYNFCFNDCGSPPNTTATASVQYPNIATIPPNTYPWGTVITYSCTPPSTLMGLSQIACINSGWSGVPGSCSGDCGNPESVANADIAPAGPYSANSNVTYTCKSPFVISLSAPVISQCMTGGQWSRNSASSNLPVCYCPNPPPISGAGITPLGPYLPLANITYSCSTSGFILNGTSTNQCTNLGGWSVVSNIACVQGCKVPLLPNGTVSPPVTIVLPGTSVSFSCSPGYIFNGTTPIICMDSGQLPGDTYNFCFNDCGSPPNTTASASVQYPNIATIPPNTYPVGTVITYSCTPPSTLMGPSQIACINSGWSGVPGSCSGVCLSPPPVLNAMIVGMKSQYFAGDSITYVCNSGYTITDVLIENNTCASNGQWNLQGASLPQCRQNDQNLNIIIIMNGGFNVDTCQPVGIISSATINGDLSRYPQFIGQRNFVTEFSKQWVTIDPTNAKSGLAVLLENGDCAQSLPPVFTYDASQTQRDTALLQTSIRCETGNAPVAVSCVGGNLLTGNQFQAALATVMVYIETTVDTNAAVERVLINTVRNNFNIGRVYTISSTQAPSANEISFLTELSGTSSVAGLGKTYGQHLGTTFTAADITTAINKMKSDVRARPVPVP